MIQTFWKMPSDYYPTGYHTLRKFFLQEKQIKEFDEKLEFLKERCGDDEELRAALDELELTQEVTNHEEFMELLSALHNTDEKCWILVKQLERVFEI